MSIIINGERRNGNSIYDCGTTIVKDVAKLFQNSNFPVDRDSKGDFY